MLEADEVEVADPFVGSKKLENETKFNVEREAPLNYC